MNYRIEQLRHQVREDPTSRQFYQLGELLRREEEFDEAVEVLRAGLEHHTRYVAAWVSLGRALFSLEHLNDASEALATSLDLDPENAVAVRYSADVAIAQEDWLGAIKALKLARVLAPGDPVLEEKIIDVEARLAEAGELEGMPGAVTGDSAAMPEPPPVEPIQPPPEIEAVEVETPATPAPEGGVDSPGSEENDRVDTEPLGTELPAAESEEAGDEPASPEPFAAAEAPAEPPTIAGDPFALDARRESGVLHTGEDVWGAESGSASAGAAEAAAAQPLTDVEETVSEPLPPQEPISAADPAPAAPFGDVEPEPAEAAAVQAEPSPPIAPVGVDDPDITDVMPLATVTLARLAMEQGDLELAERTARSVLEREPDSDGALAVLSEISRVRGGDDTAVDDGPGLDVIKIAVLQRWMTRLREAAERRAP